MPMLASDVVTSASLKWQLVAAIPNTSDADSDFIYLTFNIAILDDLPVGVRGPATG